MVDVLNVTDLDLECTFEKDLVDALREVVDGSNWQCIGHADEYLDKHCSVLYAINEDPTERNDNIAIFSVGTKGTLYAIDTVCPHEGGPLELGDIEDLDGSPVLYCPWHHYDFNLKTGKSSTGLEQQTHELRIVDNKLYINADVKLSRSPRSLSSETEQTPEVFPLNMKVNSQPSKVHQFCNDSLCEWAVKILNTADPDEKINLTYQVANRWETGDINHVGQCSPPDQPCRIENLKVVSAGKTKRLGKAGSLGSRISLIHSLANIEQWAIDLSWDIIARFSGTTQNNGQALPKDFFSDFVKVAKDEAKHYKMLSSRLKTLGSQFGDLPVHNGLWESAQETSHSLLSRLAIVHMVHEARGLDVHPKTYRRFLNSGDQETAELLEVLYKDEITHVAAGIKWFSFLCESTVPPLDKIPVFHELVRKHFRGYLKPPFDTAGRKQAGMTEAWYLPLVKQS
ncbi:uncharacterized protein LOC110252585 isoform X1 [Exaiptasia diaphana]|uniref:Rieske domain-containing protein n=1 Tax=Exaiptasia diaphana TaxID=2652724 RepID=A0A913Y4P3_EXADI|nr:uncharacterized protein LOC110252585 isoform X1 [Exaiptasia diaphana]